MNQLEDIISILSSGDEGTTNALLKTKILVYSIGKKELVSWVNYELNGYPDDNQLPEYRIVSARILANLNNGVRSYQEYPLPVSYLKDKDYEDATNCQVRLSISQIEDLVVNSGDRYTLQQPIPLDIAMLKYCKHIDKSYEITRCYKEIALHNFTSILTQVRSRLLDFVLELSDQVSSISGEKTVAEKLKQIDTSSVFKNAIFGNNTVINMGNNNSFNITHNINENDIDSLKKHLLENGIPEEDISELEVAIVSDGPIAPRSNNYGLSVGRWFSNMISKAARTTAGIGVAATTELITSALKKYYAIE